MPDKKPLAIILSDYEKFGCPHCNNAPNMEAPLHHARAGGAISFDCLACQGKFVIAHDQSERCPIGFLVEGEAGPYYPAMARHPKAPTRYLKHPDFARLGDLVQEKWTSPASRHNVANMMRLYSDWARDCPAMGMATLGAAYEALGLPECEREEPIIAARKRACRELAELCHQVDGRVSASALVPSLGIASEVWTTMAGAAAAAKTEMTIATSAMLMADSLILRAAMIKAASPPQAQASP